MCSLWPTPFGPYRNDSPSHPITEVTVSPADACSPAVPPHPSSSSSGCAAMIRTRSAIAPPLPGPRLIAQLAAAQDRAVVVFELQQQDGSGRAVPARHELAAR